MYSITKRSERQIRQLLLENRKAFKDTTKVTTKHCTGFQNTICINIIPKETDSTYTMTDYI